LGPRRTCIQPITQRSTNWKYKTKISTGTMTIKIIVSDLPTNHAVGPISGPNAAMTWAFSD